MIESAAALIAPYVEKDPTRFYTYEEFQTGVETLQTFCRLRAESVQGQLGGVIPSTEEGQASDSSTLVDASAVTLSNMGTMNRGGGFGGGQPPSLPGGGFPGGQFPGEAPAAVSGSVLLLSGVSLAVLLSGLLFALLFRRRKN